MEEFNLTVFFRVNLAWILAYLVLYWHLLISLIVAYDYYSAAIKAIFNFKKSPFASAMNHLPDHDTGLPAPKNVQQWRKQIYAKLEWIHYPKIRKTTDLLPGKIKELWQTKTWTLRKVHDKMKSSHKFWFFQICEDSAKSNLFWHLNRNKKIHHDDSDGTRQENSLEKRSIVSKILLWSSTLR